MQQSPTNSIVLRKDNQRWRVYCCHFKNSRCGAHWALVFVSNTAAYCHHLAWDIEKETSEQARYYRGEWQTPERELTEFIGKWTGDASCEISDLSNISGNFTMQFS